MELTELLAQIARLSELSDTELVTLEADLEAAAEARAEVELTDEVVGELNEISAAVNTVRTEAATRIEAAETRAAEAAAALAAIRGSDGPDDEEEEVEEEEAEPEPEAVAEDAAEDEPVVVTAAPRAPRIANVNARRPKTTEPRAQVTPETPFRELGLTASANVPGFTAGEAVQDEDKLASIFKAGIEAMAGYKHGPRFKMPLVRSGSEDPTDLGWTDDRILDGRVADNFRKIRNVTSPTSLRASGGICAPPPVDYSQNTIGGTEARPVRDEMLVRFGADHGGVVTLPPPILTDLDDAISVWTEANDASPSPNPAAKACLQVTCPTEDETLVDAIVNCLKFGNFRAKFFAPQIAAWMQLAAVNHARVAETRSLTTIGTGSTQVTHGQLLGTIPDVLAGLDLASAALVNRHRLGSMPLRWGAPRWLRNQMRADEARRIPGGGTTDERYALADARINAWLAARQINPTWFEDGETGQIFGAQGDGPLIGWPSTVTTYLYPEGSWLFLDGGTLDLGLVRDSTLNATNDVQVFSETFEATHFHGVESYRLTFDTCPDGSVAGTSDIDPCSTGS